VIDAMNPYSETSEVLDLEPSTSTEEVAKQLPGAHMVKAFNTMNYRPLGSEGREAGDEERLALFLAGDDDEAKAVVADLIDQAGFEPVDTGSLAEGGRRQQPGSDIYNSPMTAAEARRRVGA
jgi:predicted dinucleotide-binding enzyme